MTFLLQLFSIINEILIKSQLGFEEIDKLILKSIWKWKYTGSVGQA